VKARARTIIANGLKFALLLTALASLAASCRPHNELTATRCGFADPEVTTHLGICNLAAEYYVAQHEWPLSQAQLQEQLKRSIEQIGGQMSAEEAKDISEFLERFTLITFRKKGDDLVLRYRFKIEKKTVDQTVKLTPKATADEILQAAEAK
jgi:hypothetical protein